MRYTEVEFRLKNRLNVFLTASKKSICYAYPAILSLFEHNQDAEVYLYLASEDLTQEDLSAERSAAEAYGHHLQICRFDEKEAEKQIRCAHPEHWPVGAMSCYWMFHRLLPKEVDRILAIEADTVTIGSLSEFYNTDLEGYYAACPDPEHKPLTHAKQMEILGGEVLTFVGSIYDVRKIRQDFTLQDILDKDAEISAVYGQSQMELTFGVLFRGKIKYLPAPDYSVEQNRQSMERFGYDYLKKCEDTCRLLHFSSTGAKEKPWNPTCVMPGYRYWWEYAKTGPYFKEYFERQWKAYAEGVKAKEAAQKDRTIRNVLAAALFLNVILGMAGSVWLTGKWVMVMLPPLIAAAAVGLTMGIRWVAIRLQKWG